MLGRRHQDGHRFDRGIGDQFARLGMSRTDPKAIAEPRQAGVVPVGDRHDLDFRQASEDGEMDTLGDVAAAGDAEPQGRILGGGHGAGHGIGAGEGDASATPGLPEMADWRR